MILDGIRFWNGGAFVGADQIVKGVYGYRLVIRPCPIATNPRFVGRDLPS
jgi:hypothetical protein